MKFYHGLRTYFSELNNNSTALDGSGDVQKGLPTMTFSAFTSPPSTNRYFQYRTILESDSATTSWTSDGTVTQTNSAAVINTNAATFPVPTVTTKVFYKAFLKSSGTSKCELDNIEIDGTQ